jgi:FkbH-like protein
MNWLIADEDRILASIARLSAKSEKSEIYINDVFYKYSLSEVSQIAKFIRASKSWVSVWDLHIISNGTLRHLVDPLTVSLFRRGLNCDISTHEYDEGIYGDIDCPSPSRSIFLVDISLEYFEQASGVSASEGAEIYFNLLTAQLKKIDTYVGARKIVILPDFCRLALMRPMSALDRVEFDLEVCMYMKRIYGEFASVQIYSIDELIRLRGGGEIFDDKYWEIAKFSISPHNTIEYSEWLSAKVVNSVTRMIKCIALDLDNTLWGGVLGDDGYDSVRMSWDRGYSYAKIQTYFKYLKETGIPLAIVSKNDPRNVEELFEKRDDLILLREDFVGIYASWGTKSDSIKRLAVDLNIGVDSVLFLDDSQMERLEVRCALPNTIALELCGSHENFLHTIISSGYLGLGKKLSKEDSARAEMYRVESQRTQLREQVGGDEFLSLLDLTLTSRSLSNRNVARASQLINKTNQFNSTLWRIEEGGLWEVAKSDTGNVYVYSLRDRYGDYGDVSVLVTNTVDSCCTVLLWVLSCRVFSRGVEHEIVRHLIAVANRENCNELRVSYVKGPKNSVFFDVMARMTGFEFNADLGFFYATTDKLETLVPSEYKTHLQFKEINE